MATSPTAKKTATKPKTTAARKPAVRAKPAAKRAATPAKAPASVLNGTSGKAPVKAKSKRVALPKEKVKKAKLVRDSFTMPEAEYAGLGEVKKKCLKAGVDVKKSELLRIGVALIRKMDVAALKGMLASLPPLKAGRPKKD